MTDDETNGPATDRPAPGMAWIRAVRMFVLALWIGAAVYFSFVVAPSVFAVLPSREMAGLVVQRTLAVINVSGFIIGLFTLFTLIYLRGFMRPFLYWAQAGLLVLMSAACGTGQWVIAARMHFLRTQLDLPIDLIPPTDPTRIAFNQMHGYSVAVLTVAMVAALAAWIMIAVSTKISRFPK